jgi:two-component system NtrC family sensor kinase
LEQVFLNIINNSVDAIMDSAQSGTLKVRTYQEDSSVCMEFRDSGPGLKDPSKIFDPFYTTKKIGKGTGLGLSICYGIIKEHGGEISAFNHKDKGAVFLIKLPLTQPSRGFPAFA